MFSLQHGNIFPFAATNGMNWKVILDFIGGHGDNNKKRKINQPYFELVYIKHGITVGAKEISLTPIMPGMLHDNYFSRV